MLHRMVIAGLLALGTGMAWGEWSAGVDTAAGLRYCAASVSENSALQRGINFDGVVLPVGADVADDIDLTQVDGALYYELRDEPMLLDVGLALRWLDGRIQMPAVDYARAVVFDGLVPLLYGRVRIELPWHSLYAAAQAEAMNHGSDRLLDANLLVGWESPSGVALEAGYRHYRLELLHYDQLDHLNIDLSGPYTAIYLHF